MYPHQHRTLQRFVDHISDEPSSLAVIVGGSIAKGWHNEQSDVDVLLVVEPNEYARRKRNGTTAIWAEEYADYPGGAIDIKYVPPAYLDAAADRANEPTKASFKGATVPWSRDAGGSNAHAIETLIERIAEYPEDGVDERIASYLAQTEAMKWYITQAEKRQEPYLASWVVSRGVLFGCRAILAHHRVLYPYHKWLLRAVEDCAEPPAGLTELARTACRAPSQANVERFCDAVLDSRDWPQRHASWAELFIRDTEWAWMDGPAGLEDR